MSTNNTLHVVDKVCIAMTDKLSMLKELDKKTKMRINL